MENKYGGLDILVSNAAVNPGFGHILDVSALYNCYCETHMVKRHKISKNKWKINEQNINQQIVKTLQITEEVWDKIFDVNLKSAFFLCKEAIPLMEKRG